MPQNTELVPFEGPGDLANITARSPVLFLSEPKASERFWEFFTANIRNGNTRRAYYKAACRFSDWCESRGMPDFALDVFEDVLGPAAGNNPLDGASIFHGHPVKKIGVGTRKLPARPRPKSFLCSCL
jgi:hypothetical protein